MSDIKTPVLLYGLGKSGLAALRLLKIMGVAVDQIDVVDEKADEKSASIGNFNLAIHRQIPIDKHYQTLVVSPGVSLAKPEIKKLLNDGAQLASEISLAVKFLKNEKIIGITGSMGKSTTSALIHCGIEKAGRSAFLGGNFGTPLADYVADVLESKKSRDDFLVLELSSYQLENSGDLALDLSVIVSLAPNHLERYESLDEYYNAKLSIISRSRQAVIVGSQSPDLSSIVADQVRMKRFVGNKKINVVASINPENLARFKEVRNSLNKEPLLPGEHNQDNLLIATQVLKELDLERGIFGLFEFPGLNHRLENCGKVAGVQIFNDSKATSISSVHRALETIMVAYPHIKIHCLVGGRDKKLPWHSLNDFKQLSKVDFYFFGECAALARAASGISAKEFAKLSDALEESSRNAKAGEIILLSPGGTSLDEFGNFEKRGDYFKIKIKELLSQGQVK